MLWKGKKGEATNEREGKNKRGKKEVREKEVFKNNRSISGPALR